MLMLVLIQKCVKLGLHIHRKGCLPERALADGHKHPQMLLLKKLAAQRDKSSLTNRKLSGRKKV